MKQFLTFLFVLTLSAMSFAQSSESMLAVQRNDKGTLVKAARNPKAYETAVQAAIQDRTIEQMDYRGYTINLRPISGGKYELQIYTQVHYGNLQISSIFASQYESSVEYAYSYDSQTHQIRQDHFLFPPNSLTGWANPDDYVLMKVFDWNERFPSKSCDSSVYTSEEFGREYLEASCLAGRDTALRFAKKFINYILGSRGL